VFTEPLSSKAVFSGSSVLVLRCHVTLFLPQGSSGIAKGNIVITDGGFMKYTVGRVLGVSIQKYRHLKVVSYKCGYIYSGVIS
jgi:hypothetical protein